MKVGFDGRYAEGDLVGVGKYILNLVDRLAKKDIKCVIFYSRQPKHPISGKNISSKILHSKNRYIFEQINLPRALKQEKVDIYHALGNIGVPWFCPIPTVLTVHDIIPILIKDYFKYSKYKFVSKFSYWFRLKTSLWKAKRIIADSEFTKKTLVEKLNISPIKIKVIYLGSPEENRETDKLPSGLEPGKYILNHGGIDIRKNLDRLIRAFAKVVSEMPELKLVITGENEGMKKGLREEVKNLNIENLVIFSGYVEEKVLWSLIRQANCICYPSLIEGFGGPILEGFAAGVPVITSNTSSLPEISGDATYLIDPEDEEDIAQAILTIIKDKNLRKDLINRGKKRIKKFSWERTTEKVIKIYREIKG